MGMSLTVWKKGEESLAKTGPPQINMKVRAPRIALTKEQGFKLCVYLFAAGREFGRAILVG